MEPVCSVLIADDDDDVRTLISVSLRKAGFAVTAAGCGSEALAAARHADVQVYALDVGMPDLNAQSLQADGRQPGSSDQLGLVVGARRGRIRCRSL